MGFKLNYDIPREGIRDLEKIAQTDGYLQVLRMNPDWASMLEVKARLMETISSLGIEGTVVTIDQAKAITIGEKDIKIGEKEKREFEGYFESLKYTKAQVGEKLSLQMLLKIHEMITRGDPKAMPGKIRNDLRRVSRRGKTVYTPPPPDQLSYLLRDFFEWFNRAAEDKNVSPVIAAALCHFWFVWIHPFCDGNGRVGRLLTTFLLLKKKSEGIRYFALSDYYNKHQDSYYDALANANVCKPDVPSMNFDSDLDSWISYFITSYLAQMREIKEVTNRILQLNIRVQHLREKGLISDTHNKVLAFLSSRERASYQELQDHISVSKPRVNQILKPLRSAHILVEEKIGKVIWFKLGAPEDEPDETIFKKKTKKTQTIKRLTKKRYEPGDQMILPIFE